MPRFVEISQPRAYSPVREESYEAFGIGDRHSGRKTKTLKAIVFALYDKGKPTTVPAK